MPRPGAIGSASRVDGSLDNEGEHPATVGPSDEQQTLPRKLSLRWVRDRYGCVLCDLLQIARRNAALPELVDRDPGRY
jgi:hypothetical protein